MQGLHPFLCQFARLTDGQTDTERLRLTSRAMPTALVVTDGSWVANEVRSALALGSWEIEEINDPTAVAPRLAESRVDAVIIDMQVGAKGGMAVVRKVRQVTDPFDRPRLVMLLDRSADSFLAGRAGADAAVLKPFDAAALRAAVGMTPVGVASSEEE